MGRAANANAKTLNWAVRQVFKPVITEVPVKRLAAAGKDGIATSSVVDGFIPTQPPDQPSAKSLGKRRLVEIEDGEEHQSSTDAAALENPCRYTKSTLPPSLRKCRRAVAVGKPVLIAKL